MLRPQEGRKKRKKISLPFRTTPGAEHTRHLTKRTRVIRNRWAITASTRSQNPSGQRHLQQDESEDDVEETIRSQPAARQQPLIESLAQSNRSISLFATRSEPLSNQQYAQECVELDTYTNGPFTLLGLGGKDPFSTLPTDLPRKFIDERLHTSKLYFLYLTHVFRS
jgi:hypothetical protein